MATDAVKTRLTNKASQAVWEGLACGEDGDAVSFEDHPAKSVQVEGDFNSETVSFDVSNDGQNWHDSGITGLTSADVVSVPIQTRYIRPSFSGSSGGDVDVTIFGSEV